MTLRWGMLKKHQIKRAIEKLIADRSDLEFLSTIGSESFLRLSQDSRKAPKFRFLRLDFNKQKRCLEVSSGVGFFPSVTAIKLAPSFFSWKTCDFGWIDAGSKKSSRQALKNVLSQFKAEIHGNYSVLQSLFDNSPVHQLYKDFHKQQKALASEDADSIAFFKREASPKHFAELSLLAQHDVECELDDEHLEALLDSLTAEGEYTDTSSFSLNKDKALQKMAKFQLGDRYLFPLFLASGLSLLGASELEITVDSDEIWVGFRELAIEQRTLNLLTSLVLSGERDSKSVGYEKLAQALLQSSGHEPSVLEFQYDETSVDLKHFPRLELNPKENFQTDSGVFYCKLPPSLKVAQRFLTSLAKGHSEVKELRKSLRLLPTPWSLNGEAQEFGIRPTKGSLVFTWFHEGIMEPKLHLEESFYQETSKSTVPANILFLLEPEVEPSLTTILEGIVVENPPLKFELEFSVYLWVNNMNTDLSGRKLVQNQLLEELLDALHGYHDEVSQKLGSIFRSLDKKRSLFWQRGVLEKAYHSSLSQVFRQIPILERIGSEELFPVSEATGIGLPLYTTEFFERGLRDKRIVNLIQPTTVDHFHMMFPQSHDVTHLLQSAKLYYEHYERWLSTPTEALELQIADSNLRISIPEHRGEIAFSEEARPPVRLLCQSRRLPIDCSHWVPESVELYVNHDDLEMDDAWKTIKNQDLLNTIRARVHSALESLIDRLARQPMTDEGHQRRMRSSMTFLKRSGRSLKRWQDVAFIEETRTVMDTTGPVPLPKRITEYFSLRERPNGI